MDGTLGTDAAAGSSVLADLIHEWRSAGLDDREIKVELLARAGWSNKAIGSEIRRSESTVRSIRKGAQQKLFPKQPSDQD